jgi:hypothetical protein
MIWSGLYLIGTTGAGGPMMIRGAERTLNMMQPERLGTCGSLSTSNLTLMEDFRLWLRSGAFGGGRSNLEFDVQC